MKRETRTKADLAKMIAERIGFDATQVIIHQHSNAPWSVTVIGATRSISEGQYRAEQIAAELRAKYDLKG